MTVRTDGERLAVVESQIGALDRKIDSVAADVKTIAAVVTQIQVTQAAAAVAAANVKDVQIEGDAQRRRNVDNIVKWMAVGLSLFNTAIIVFGILYAAAGAER